MSQTTSKSNSKFSFYQALNSLLKGFSERSREIVKFRYGMTGNGPKTLEEIGKEYQITRERIRQIIKEVVRKIKKDIDNPALGEAKREIEFTIESKNGIIKKDDLLHVLGKGDQKGARSNRFFPWFV